MPSKVNPQGVFIVDNAGGARVSGGKVSVTAPAGGAASNVNVQDVSGDVRVTAGNLPIAVSVAGVAVSGGKISVTAPAGSGTGASAVMVTGAAQVSIQGVNITSSALNVVLAAEATAKLTASNPLSVSAAGGQIGVAVTGNVGISAGTPITISAAGAVLPGPAIPGKVYVSGEMTAIHDAAITIAASAGNYEVVAAVSGQAIRVLEYAFVTPGTAGVVFRSSTGGANLTGGMVVARGISRGFNPVGYFQTEVSHALTIQTETAASVGGSLTWIGV